MKTLTWSELAKLINQLPEAEKAKPVFLLINDENSFKKVNGLETIPEDVYYNKEDHEDCGDLKTLKECHGEAYNRENYELSTPKGTAFLWSDEFLKPETICKCCKKEVDEVFECRKCNELICENCTVPYDQFTQIDYTLCNNCNRN
jgi:hypothetical protein